MKISRLIQKVIQTEQRRLVWALRWARGHKRAVLSTVVICLVATFGALFIFKTQLPFAAQVAGNTIAHRVDQPIMVQFEQAVQAGFTATIYPEVAGDWQSVRGVFGVEKTAFMPASKKFAPAVSYTVTVKQLRRVTGQPLPDVSFTVTTETAPAITALNPGNGAQNVVPGTSLTAVLERANRGLRALHAALAPAVELMAQPPTGDDTVYTWQPNAPLKQGQTYTFELFDNNSYEPQKPVATSAFTVVAEPQIASATNRDYFYQGDTIDVVFDVSMQQDKPALVCGCNGEGKWLDDKRYQFTPTGLAVAHAYGYTVPAGLTSVAGGVREADTRYEIKTPGAVMANIRGLGNAASTNAEIVVSFDQPVDRSSAESRFSLSPAVAGSFRWQGNTVMIFTPTTLEAQTSYRATVAPGVKPIKFGLDSTGNFGMHFTTAAPVVKLNVPLYRQQHRSSCEAAALRMALAFRGIHDTDFNIVQRMGYNGQHKNQSANTWDDPFEMYVGDVNGLQSTFQGYGAYAPPIAKAAQSYGRNATVHYGVSANFIAEQIHAGNPVIIIGTVGGLSPRYISWNGPNGLVHAWIGEHARTVIGVTGKPNAPISFLVNDPNTGVQLRWSPAQLMADINAIGQLPSQAVVIY